MNRGMGVAVRAAACKRAAVPLAAKSGQKRAFGLRKNQFVEEWDGFKPDMHKSFSVNR